MRGRPCRGMIGDNNEGDEVTDEHVDGDIEAPAWEELWETPVGRRWLLKAGLGLAVAAVGTAVRRAGVGRLEQDREPGRGSR